MTLVDVSLTSAQWAACREALGQAYLALPVPPGRLTRAALGIALGRPVDEAEATTIILILQATA